MVRIRKTPRGPAGAHLKMMPKPFRQRKGDAEASHSLVSTSSVLGTWHNAPLYVITNTTV